MNETHGIIIILGEKNKNKINFINETAASMFKFIENNGLATNHCQTVRV